MTQATTALAAIGALVFTGLSLKATQEQNAAQNTLAAQGQYTDRYTKAIDQLGQKGNDRLQIRLGGIYALERLAHDSPSDQPTIIEVLTAFVRTNAPMPRDPIQCHLVPLDVQAALTVLGRRNSAHDQGTQLDLNNTCIGEVGMSGANLTGAHLDNADLTGAHLNSAELNYAHLIVAQLNNADLNYAHLNYAHLIEALLNNVDLDNADLTGANLTGAHLKYTNLTGAHLNNAHLNNADLTGADLTGADLTGAIHDSKTAINSAKTDSKTLGRWW